MGTTFTDDGFLIEAQDLSNASPNSEDHRRVYNHDGSSSLTLTDGSTTSRRGWYMWDNNSGSWFPMGQHADLVDGYHGQDLAAIADDRSITGSWTFETKPTLSGGQWGESDLDFEEVPLSIPVTKWADGLADEEIWRVELAAGQSLEVHRLEIQPKGGGDVTGLDVDFYDATNASVIASTTDVATGNPIGTSGDGANCIVRVSNSSGSYQNAGIGGRVHIV